MALPTCFITLKGQDIIDNQTIIMQSYEGTIQHNPLRLQTGISRTLYVVSSFSCIYEIKLTLNYSLKTMNILHIRKSQLRSVYDF